MWIKADQPDQSLRFLIPGSRLLLNSSQPESCLTNSRTPLGYQTISGEWVALTPHLQLVTNPQEEAKDFAEPEVGNIKVRGQSRPYLEEIWYRWAKYHPRQFGQRLTRQRMGTFNLSILNGKVLQGGSNTQEFRGFLRTLETTETCSDTHEFQDFLRTLETAGTWPQAAEFAVTPTLTWMTRIGNGCVISVVCWLGLGCPVRYITHNTHNRTCTGLACGVTRLRKEEGNNRAMRSYGVNATDSAQWKRTAQENHENCTQARPIPRGYPATSRFSTF